VVKYDRLKRESTREGLLRADSAFTATGDPRPENQLGLDSRRTL